MRFTAARSASRRGRRSKPRPFRDSTPVGCCKTPSRGVRAGADAPGEACRGPMREARLHGMAAVNGRPIPDAHEPARPLTPQVLQHGHHTRRTHGVGLAVAIPLPLRRSRTHGGEGSTGPPCPPERRVPHRGIGAHEARQVRSARPISAEAALWRFLRPCLMAGQGSSRGRVSSADGRFLR
jgi:hypothetical protein